VRARLARLLVLLAGCAAVIGGLFVVLATLQRRLLYFPVHDDLDRATQAASQRRAVPWIEGGQFLGWRSASPERPARAVLLVLHGNAGSALDRLYFRDVFQAAGAVDVVLLEYPGYGPRPGEPSQATLVAACRDAVALLARGGVPVVLVGESLGSAVAALASAEERATIAGLLLVTPLASVTAVAKRHYPFIPSALVADAYRADLALPRYAGPVAFLVAGRDEVVFTDLGLGLYEARTGPKRLWIEDGASHNGLRYDPADPKWAEILRFLVPSSSR